MRRCWCASKRQRFSERSSPSAHSRRRIICAWSSKRWSRKSIWSAWLDASMPGPVTASQPLSSMTEGRSSPLSVPARCWSIGWASSQSKRPRMRPQQRGPSRLSFQGRWYVCPGLLSRLAGREFDVYYDRRDVGVLYIFVEGEYVGEAYCPQLMGGRVSEWEARAMRTYDEQQAKIARAQGLPVRARIQDEAEAARRRRSTEIRAREQARQWDRQRQDIHPAEVVERLASVEAKKV